jgi:23S rRNA pseudouridine1911/1915/1917 synthase
VTDEGEPRRLRVSPADAGARLDAWVAERFELSRTRVQKLVDAGRIRVQVDEGEWRVPKKSEVVDERWWVEVVVPAATPVGLVPQDLPLRIVYQDADLAVVDKEAGMVVHPAPGHRDGTLVNALLHHLTDLSGVGGRLRPGIVHRLDRDTSGLLVVAKTDRAHHALSDALRARKVKRLYLAASWGHLDEPEVTVDRPLARDPRDRKRMAVVEGGRHALTRLRVRERWVAAELLDVALQTGRTHQIRVHLASIGHPVVGDPVYGSGRERGMSGPALGWARTMAAKVPRQFLHAARLVFDHPVTGETMRFEAPLPADLQAAADWARRSDTSDRT